jgi:hypothetical protein
MAYASSSGALLWLVTRQTETLKGPVGTANAAGAGIGQERTSRGRRQAVLVGRYVASLPLRMLWNIIDHRERPYRWKRVNAVIEATLNDNSVTDADQVELSDEDVVYDERARISVADAVRWALGQAPRSAC